MKKIILILTVLMIGILSINDVNAQQDALFSQYMFNKLLINPAYAGSRDAISVSMIGRRQWVGIEDGPQTLSFSVQSPLKNDKLGLGFYVFTDILGPTQTTGFIGTFAYKLYLGRNGKLSFGIQVGVRHSYYDYNKMNIPDPNDPVLEGNISKQVIPDANFGIYYYKPNWYVGVSSKHLFEQQYGYLQKPDGSVYGVLLRHFYGMGGVAIPLGDKLTLVPSTLVKYVQNAPLQADINASLLINEVLWIGASYRTEKVMVALLEVVIAKKLRIGYSYDYSLNEIQDYNTGSHEILLEYNIPFKNRMLTPRYF